MRRITMKLQALKWANNYNSSHLVNNQKQEDPYANSPFLGLKSLSSRTKGAIFEKIVEEKLIEEGYCVASPKSSEYDRLVNGKRVEIKGSFLWGTSSYFKWQQLRPEQSYDYAIFLAVYPDRIDFFGATKKDIDSYVLQKDSCGNFRHAQHGGNKGVSPNTFLISGSPSDHKGLLTPLSTFLKGI